MWFPSCPESNSLDYCVWRIIKTVGGLNNHPKICMNVNHLTRACRGGIDAEDGFIEEHFKKLNFYFENIYSFFFRYCNFSPSNRTMYIFIISLQAALLVDFSCCSGLLGLWPSAIHVHESYKELFYLYSTP